MQLACHLRRSLQVSAHGHPSSRYFVQSARPAVSVPASASAANAALKLRQTQAEYVAARPSGEPGVKPMMSSSKMYVCRRCQANFKTGDGKPDSRLPGLGKCNKCLAAQAASAIAA